MFEKKLLTKFLLHVGSICGFIIEMTKILMLKINFNKKLKIFEDFLTDKIWSYKCIIVMFSLSPKRRTLGTIDLYCTCKLLFYFH